MNGIQITGILPALVSPVNEDGSIREAALRKLVRDLARTGISGFYLCGATGEGIAMAPERRMELVEIVKDEAPSGMKLINHIGAADLATVRRLARHSRQIGLDAISSVPPFFFSYDEKGVLDYYRAMAEASEGLPLLVYACPLSGTPLPVSTIEKMLDTAMEGTYSETQFDESRLSALETKFANYLSSSEISAQNVKVEKDKIKTLIADISHQTKTPIANLLLYSELIAEQDLPEEMRSNIRIIQQQTEKLRFLIDSLVKLSRLENGILTLSPRQQAVGPMLEEIQRQYLSKAQKKGLQLQLIATEARATFDRKWTAEALGNLIENAIKYTPCGSVTLKAMEYELFTRIDVTDTGIGIEESEQPKIFARFYRSETVREDEGVGIGLYLAREIISGEGGYIKLISQKGKGSTFSVFLPR